MDKKTYCKRFAIWTAVAVVALMTILGLSIGKVIEETLFEEIIKGTVMTIVLVCIFEVFVYVFAPLFWHIKNDGKNDKENLGMD